MFLFGSEIRKKAVRVDAARIRVVDAGETSLIVQVVSALEEGERQALEVQFADGKAPERAVFVLVPHASEVDTFINVTRRETPAPTCPAEVRAGVRGPEDFPGERPGALQAIRHLHHDMLAAPPAAGVEPA